MADLSSNVLAFCALLRAEYGIDAGYDRAIEALRAVEAVTVFDRRRVRDAMRLSLCSSAEQRQRFDRAFDAFFGRGLRRARRIQSVPQPCENAAYAAGQTATPHDGEEARGASQIVAARYSAAASVAQSDPVLSRSGLAAALAQAGKLLHALRLGRSRRWKPLAGGTRFDFRGTLRGSFHTGGDVVRIRRLGHPFRNPRVAMLIDASRSMTEHVPPLLQFGYALVRRSKRVRVFVFSTALRDVTRQLRRSGDLTLRELGEAWGGGTRIGAALAQFARMGASSIDADTLIIVASDGFDMDRGPAFQHAIREIHRRAAGILSLNPHANSSGFDPSARAMKAALPYLTALLDANDISKTASAVRNLRR